MEHTAQQSLAFSYFTYRCPFGSLTIETNGAAITCVALGICKLRGQQRATALTNKAANQIVEYCYGKRRTFEVALAPAGTPFQLRVWEAVACIPYGQGMSVSDVAQQMGCAQSYRSVGTAIKKCPLAILIPTHRIVPAHGKKSNATKANVLNAALLKEEQRHLGLV